MDTIAAATTAKIATPAPINSGVFDELGGLAGGAP
jgi:hypothetical protein